MKKTKKKKKETAREYAQYLIRNIDDIELKPWLRPAVETHLRHAGYPQSEIEATTNEIFHEEHADADNQGV